MGLSKKKRRIGEAWSSNCSQDKTHEIFISPYVADAPTVAATLVHEIVHCIVGIPAKHGKLFRDCAVAVGLEGKMTATKAGDDLTLRLHDFASQIGDYPHASLDSSISDAPPKQTTRMILIRCPDCGYQVRTTRKWIEIGIPTCPCGTKMEAEQKEDEDESPD
jgi:hypothetical protein